MANSSGGGKSIICKEDYDPESGADEARGNRGSRGGSRAGRFHDPDESMRRRVFYLDLGEILHLLFLGGLVALLWRSGAGLLRSLRPAALWALMGGIVFGRKVKSAAGTAREEMEDLTAEALNKLDKGGDDAI
jgi:hypothetical protein